MRFRQISTLLFFTILFSVTYAAYVNNRTKPRQTKILTPFPAGKHLAVVKVEILEPQEIPDSKEENLNITARIMINDHSNGSLSYNWTLPEGVTMTSGKQTDVLTNISAGQVFTIQISVVGFDKKTQKFISLNASIKSGGNVLGNSAILASRTEDTLEAEAPKMRAEAVKQLGSGRRATTVNAE